MHFQQLGICQNLFGLPICDESVVSQERTDKAVRLEEIRSQETKSASENSEALCFEKEADQTLYYGTANLNCVSIVTLLYHGK